MAQQLHAPPPYTSALASQTAVQRRGGAAHAAPAASNETAAAPAGWCQVLGSRRRRWPAAAAGKPARQASPGPAAAPSWVDRDGRPMGLGLSLQASHARALRVVVVIPAPHATTSLIDCATRIASSNPFPLCSFVAFEFATLVAKPPPTHHQTFAATRQGRITPAQSIVMAQQQRQRRCCFTTSSPTAGWLCSSSSSGDCRLHHQGERLHTRQPHLLPPADLTGCTACSR